MKAKWFSTLLVLVMLLASLVPVVGAAPSAQEGDPQFGSNSDNARHPLGDEQAALQQAGFEAKVNGKAHGKTHEVARGQFVELAREGEDTIWTVTGEFGNAVHPAYGGD